MTPPVSTRVLSTSPPDPALPGSEFYVEKRRTRATLTLSTGQTARGYFVLAESAETHAGQERIVDLLNSALGFFPFELEPGSHGPARVVLYNRSHVVLVHLPGPEEDLRKDASFTTATQKTAAMLLSTGERISGEVYVFRPPGRDRLSDYARLKETFRYLETPSRTLIVNFSHVVEIVPIVE
jgi:hypothetical protein